VTTLLHQVPSLRISGVVLPLPLYTFLACTDSNVSHCHLICTSSSDVETMGGIDVFYVGNMIFCSPSKISRIKPHILARFVNTQDYRYLHKEALVLSTTQKFSRSILSCCLVVQC
jgi:hypothetical protein